MIYMDNASGTHPKPDDVYTAQESVLREMMRSPFGLGGTGTADLMESTRQAAADLFGVGHRRRVIFTLNGTDALNMALKGYLRDGDHVVTSTLEHAAVARPLTHLQMKGRISLTRIDGGVDGCIDPSVVEHSLRPRTRLVVLGHGCSALGTVQPMEAIARLVRRRGARLLVDACHTAGLVPMDVDGWGMDLVAMSGHKGLFGPPGIGLLLLGEGVRLRPFREGAGGGDPSLSIQPLELPWQLEAGMPNLPGIAGLRAGLKFIAARGVAEIQARQTTLIKRFVGAIGLDERFRLFAARGDLARTGTVSFRLKPFAPRQVETVLAHSYGIHVAAGLHASPDVHRTMGSFPEGTVRISVSWFSSEGDVDRTVAALREIADAGLEGSMRLGARHAGRLTGRAT